ncbi:pilus assembly protein TadG-related protein [Nocardioides limicola]|uniref:pilus assembly protein TadG-related protein n=1 Tax=Nocardioides limicola TaxID=2803368 RepID=UPI00193B5BD6|nr:pilus assembly protein TadG-related protein [Nocardioides sp. DJM-14]
MTVFVLLLVTALMSMAGLVIDAGGALATKRQAATAAEHAARVGADALDSASLRSGHPVVAPARARTAAHSYLTRIGATGTVTVSGDTVTVTVTDRYKTALLTLIGINRLDVAATAAAVSINEDGN